MSLLIDALRKAEQAKREARPAGDGDPAFAHAPAAAEPATAPGPPPRPRPLAPGDELAFRGREPGRGDLGEDSAGLGLSSGSWSSTEPQAAVRDAARVLFDAKTASRPPGRLLPFAAVAALVGLGFAGYVWWAIQPSGGLGAPPPAAPPTPPAAPIAAAPAISAPATPTPPASTPPTSAAQSVPRAAPASRAAIPSPAPAPYAPPDAATDPPAAAPATAATDAAIDPAPPPREARTRARPAVASATPSQVEPGLGPIRRGGAAPARASGVAAAYAAYVAGSLDEARRLYRQALEAAPSDRDALNGLAALSLREGRRDEAKDWFRRALAVDPDDPVATAGLANLDSPQAPIEIQSRLQNLLAAADEDAPRTAPAHFALGNALALQRRWAEAERAYFRAHALDAGNPDYLFNLAVSLDHLNQPAQARDFYAQALAAAASRPAAFDATAARERIDALGPSVGGTTPTPP